MSHTTEIKQTLVCAVCGRKTETNTLVTGSPDEEATILALEPVIREGWTVAHSSDTFCPQHSSRLPCWTKHEVWRRLHKAGFSQAAIARAFDTSRQSVHRAVTDAA